LLAGAVEGELDELFLSVGDYGPCVLL